MLAIKYRKYAPDWDDIDFFWTEIYDVLTSVFKGYWQLKSFKPVKSNVSIERYLLYLKHEREIELLDYFCYLIYYFNKKPFKDKKGFEFIRNIALYGHAIFGRLSMILVVNDIADCGKSYYEPFRKFGKRTTDIDILKNDPTSIDLVVFTGGADVSPELYGAKPHSKTYTNPPRDSKEVKVFNLAKELNLPMVGICRGAQFLCVMAGGKLIQHVENHHSNHLMQIQEGKTININSIHHQMQLPPKDAIVLGWCDPPISNCHWLDNDNQIKVKKESEVVYYPNINAIGFQYHPEIMDKESEGFKYCVRMTETLLEDTVVLDEVDELVGDICD